MSLGVPWGEFWAWIIETASVDLRLHINANLTCKLEDSLFVNYKDTKVLGIRIPAPKPSIIRQGERRSAGKDSQHWGRGRRQMDERHKQWGLWTHTDRCNRNCSILVYIPWTLILSTSVCCETCWGKEEIKWCLTSYNFPPLFLPSFSPPSPTPGMYDMMIAPSKTLKSYAPLPVTFFFFQLIQFDLATIMRWKQPCLLVCRINFFVLFLFSFTKKATDKKKEQIKCWWRSP